MTRKLLTAATLEMELTNGNDGRGNKWFSSAKVRKTFEDYLRLKGLVRTPFDQPVVIELTRILGKNQRLWDSDSKLRGNSKELIDALVACGWFHDDKPKWVVDTFCHQDTTQREVGPAIKVEIYDG